MSIHVAQLAEHCIGIAEIVGANPTEASEVFSELSLQLL